MELALLKFNNGYQTVMASKDIWLDPCLISGMSARNDSDTNIKFVGTLR